MNKTIFLTLALLSTSTLLYGCATTATTSYNEQQVVDVATMTAIEIQGANADVTIQPSNDSKATAHFYGDGEEGAYQLRVEPSGTRLKLILEHDNSFKLFNLTGFHKNLHLDVSLPKQAYEKLVLQTSSGEIHVQDGLTAQQIDVMSSSGNVDLQHLAGDTLGVATSSGRITLTDITEKTGVHLNSSSGNQTVNQVKTTLLSAESSSGTENYQHVTGDVQVHTSSGNVTLQLDALGQKIAIQTSSGKSTLSLPSNSSFDLSFDTSSGSFNSSIPLTLRSQDKKHVEGSFGNGGTLVKVDSSSGNLNVQKDEE